MSNAQSVIESALCLSEKERANVALLILDSLHPDTLDVDKIIAEAERRDSEMDSGIVQEISHEQFLLGIQRPVVSE